MFEFELPLPQTFIDYKSEVFVFKVFHKTFPPDFFLQIYKTISRRVRDVYFDGKPITTDNLDRAHILLSDVFVLYGIDLSARLHAKNLNARTFFSKYDANNRL